MAGPAPLARTPELRFSLGDPRFVVIVLGTIGLALFPIVAFYWGKTYLISLVAKMLIFAIAAASLDLILGYGGMVSFGHAAYIGLGAYAVAVFSKYGVDNGYLQLACAVAGSALIALAIGAISLRTSGLYFIMITLAFTQMLYYLGISLEPFGGDDGMNTRRSTFGFFTLNDNVLGPKAGDRDGIAIYYAAFAALVATVIFLRRLVASRFGMAIRGAMSNPVRMQAIGFPIYRYRLVAFVLAGAICGVAGFLFANHQQFLSPVYMNWLRSGEIMIMVILGGVGTIYGPVIGAIGLIALEDALEDHVGKDYWMMVLGPLLVLIVLFANRGIYSLIPDRARGLPRFFAGLALLVGGLVATIWLISKASPLHLLGRMEHLPLYVIAAAILLALALRHRQDNRARHG
jgi:branched-chain amino acid transport system permease protein